MKILFMILFTVSAFANTNQSAYKFLKEKSLKSRRVYQYNQYEDIISGSIAFTIGNIGYFTTDSLTLQIAYSGVQTVGIVAVGHGIYDHYYPDFDERLLSLLSKKRMTRGQLSDGYVSLLGEMDRAKRLSLLWSSSLLTLQYGLNSFLGRDVPSDLKDIYLFLGGINAIIATYSYMSKTDYETYYLDHSPKVGMMMIPNGYGLTLTKKFD